LSNPEREPIQTVTGVVLAGGRASRMQGMDKGLVKLDGVALIEYVIEAVKPQVDRLLINANRNVEQYGAYGYPVIRDSVADYQGPLAGILTALEKIDTDLLLCVPCDSPWLPADLQQRLQISMCEHDAEISCVTDGKRLHPVFALLKRSLRKDLANYIHGGGRAVHRWFESRRLSLVDFSQMPELFVNLNTQDDVLRIETHMLRKTDF
jgi:molybdopterin-guanine dinucleotide biosynthesis protein A